VAFVATVNVVVKVPLASAVASAAVDEPPPRRNTVLTVSPGV
jgi:hypothetical protein